MWFSSGLPYGCIYDCTHKETYWKQALNVSLCPKDYGEIEIITSCNFLPRVSEIYSTVTVFPVFFSPLQKSCTRSRRHTMLAATVNSWSRGCVCPVCHQAKWWGRSLSAAHPLQAFISSSSVDSLMSSRTKPGKKARLLRLQERGRTGNNAQQRASHLQHDHTSVTSLYVYHTDMFVWLQHMNTSH